MSSIHEAAEDGREEELQKLIQRNIQAVNEEDEYGETPLHLACMAGHPNCVKLLLHNGAQVDCQNSNGTTPLHYAARYGRQACVTLLLRNGANVARKDNAHWTPLHYAAINAQTKCAALLIEKGADANALTSDHNSPLHLAASAGVLDCVLLLVKHGAKLSAKNKEGNTPLSLLTIKAKAAVDKEKNSLKRLSEDLRGLVNDKTYADVAFIIEGEDRRTLYGHKNIICQRCPRLKEIIQQHERHKGTNGSTSEPEQIGNLTIVHVQGMSASVFENLLHFVCTGEVPALVSLAAFLSSASSETDKVRELAQLVELLRAAEIYQYSHLADYCEEILSANLNVESAIEFLSATDYRKKGATGLREWGTLPGMNNDDVSRQCLARVRKTFGEYLIAHFNEAVESKGFRKVKKEMIVDLLPELSVEQKHKPAEYVRRVPKKVEKVDAMKGNILLECKKIMTSLISDADAWPFNQPVDPVALGIPTYFDIIKEPMDFGTINQKLKNGKYEVLAQFERDVHLVFANALLFNEPDSDIGYWAKKLRGLFERRLVRVHNMLKEEKERYASAAPQQQQPAVAAGPPAAQKEPAASTSTSTTTSSSSSSSSSSSAGASLTGAKKKPSRPVAAATPVAKAAPATVISPEELEVARARLSQNVNRLSPHQLMEVLTMIQQASSMPTGEEGDSNGDIEIDLNELPPDALVRIQAYVDSCLAGNGTDPGDEEHEEMTLEEEDEPVAAAPATAVKTVSAPRKRQRSEFDFDATPEELGGGLDPKNENGVARQQRREKGRERRKDKADRGGGGGSGSGSDAGGGGDKKRKRHHHHHSSSLASSSTPSGGYASPGNAGTPGVSGSSASAAAAAQQRKERKRVKEERDETYSQGGGGGRRNESSGYAPTSFEHIEFGHS